MDAIKILRIKCWVKPLSNGMVNRTGLYRVFYSKGNQRKLEYAIIPAQDELQAYTTAMQSIDRNYDRCNPDAQEQTEQARTDTQTEPETKEAE